MRPALLLAAVCLGWGTIPLVADRTQLPATAITFGRVWIAAAGLAVAFALTRPPGPRLLAHRPARSVAAGVVLAAHWTAMFAAYRRAPDATVIFVIFLAPVVIALVERPAAPLVGALAVAVTGFALVAAPTFDAPMRDVRVGVALAVLAGALFVVLVLLAKPLAEVYGGLRLALLEMVVAGVVLVPGAAVADWRGAPDALGWLVLLGLVHTAVGTAVYLHALARRPATEVGILGYLEPVGVVLFAWLLVGDRPSAATMLGGALVVAGGTLAVSSSTSEEVSGRVPG